MQKRYISHLEHMRYIENALNAIKLMLSTLNSVLT